MGMGCSLLELMMWARPGLLAFREHGGKASDAICELALLECGKAEHEPLHIVVLDRMARNCRSYKAGGVGPPGQFDVTRVARQFLAQAGDDVHAAIGSSRLQ